MKNSAIKQHSTAAIAAAKQLRAHLSMKSLSDWCWLLGHLSGKLVIVLLGTGQGNGLHHLLSSAASLIDWIHRDPNSPKGKQ